MQLQPSDALPKIMLARYYGSNLGRFLSVDPVVRPQRNAQEPQRWNRYVYSANNPLKFFDPDGREYTTVDSRFAAGLQGIRNSGSATGNRVLDTFAKNTSNPSTGVVASGVPWGVRDANGNDVGPVFKADGSKPTSAEITAAGGTSAVPRSGESVPAQVDANGNVVKEGVVAVYPDAKQYEPSAAGMSDQEYIEKNIVHETSHQNGNSGEAVPEQEEKDYIDEKKQSQQSQPQQKTP